MPVVFVIIGPAGVGKGTLIRGLRERVPGLALSVSATTRRARPGEINGVHYHFLTPEEFDRAGEFVEQATYAGHRYGTLRSELERALQDGHSVVLEIEVEGARQIQRAIPDAVTVFIAPPSLDALRDRLHRRGTDTAEQIEQRLATARRELAAQREFAHVIVNDDVARATNELVEIVERSLAAERAGAQAQAPANLGASQRRD